MERKSITVDGKIISYKIAGDGKALMLLHGFGADSNIWDEQISFLSKNYLIIAPDLPGVSSSELTNDVSMEGLANIARLIAEEEELDKLALIGHSMGGYATLAFAEKYPELLNGFGLFHSAAWADTIEKKETRKKGTCAPKERAISAISGSSVETST